MRSGISKHKFCRRVLLLPGMQRPTVIVAIENRRNGDQIHVGFVISVNGSDIAPIGSLFLVLVDKVVGEYAIFLDDPRQHVLTEVVRRKRIFGVGNQNRHQQLGVEEIDAH